MRYKAEFDDYSETNKFLDELFEEDCEFGWSCEQPQPKSPHNITVVQPEGSAEETYLKTLAEEMGEKIMEILDKASTLPTERDRGQFLTKEELVARLISISNSLDMLLCDMEDASGAGFAGTTTIIGGTLPLAPKMF